MDCEIVQLCITKKGLWYTLWIIKEEEKEYYCLLIAGNGYKLYNLIKDLSLTKQYLSQKFNDIITNFIDEFDLYLNNYVNYSQTLYDNLCKYTEEKIKNNTNIQSTLNEYKSIINNILTKNTEKKIMEKNALNNNFNKSKIVNIISKLENNIFEMNNKFYLDYYLKNNKLFLEYPDEIILKLNQSENNLRTNNENIKNKINLSLNNRLKNIISSTKLFINFTHQFNLKYIMNSINKENIFDKYFLSKTTLIKSFFNSVYN